MPEHRMRFRFHVAVGELSETVHEEYFETQKEAEDAFAKWSVPNITITLVWKPNRGEVITLNPESGEVKDACGFTLYQFSTQRELLQRQSSRPPDGDSGGEMTKDEIVDEAMGKESGE